MKYRLERLKSNYLLVKFLLSPIHKCLCINEEQDWDHQGGEGEEDKEMYLVIEC